MSKERDDVTAMLDALVGPEVKARMMAAIRSIEDNAERIGTFANGGVDDAYTTTDGARVPSMRWIAREHRTLHDWFAGQALTGFCACTDSDGTDTLWGAADAARASYNYADAMMAERAKRQANGQ